MYVTKILFTSCILFCVYADDPLVQQAFEEAGLVPSIIPTAPKDLLTVTFGDITVNLGNEITPEQASGQPTVVFNGVSDTLYAYLVIDPDAMRENTYICHGMILNVDGATSDVTAGDHIVEYKAPSPPAGQGYHKYVFLIYQQENRISPDIDQQMSINVIDFAKNYTLSGPLFGNFFKAQAASS